MPMLQNKTFDEISIGDRAEASRRLTRKDIQLFAILSGDLNPTHLDDAFARDSEFHEVVAHGMWGGSLISAVLGNQLPGPGTVYREQNLRFLRPVHLGDRLTVAIVVTDKSASDQTIVFDCSCVNQAGERVIEGEATVVAPASRIVSDQAELPEIRMMERARYAALMKEVSTLPPLKVAIVHPTHPERMQGIQLATEANIIEPILIGPRAKITAAIEQAKVQLPNVEIVDAPHSHAAAEKAVEWVRAGKADTLMKGNLHTSELLKAILHKSLGIRTERRMSHAYIFDVPTYPRALMITDAAINIYPDIKVSADIVQNAIDFATSLGIRKPKVALLSAVETVNPRIESTLRAAALCKMADRGQITGGILDGPLAFDNAVSLMAADVKNIHSPVAGQADILVAPDLEAANMLAKQLEHLADAQGAGLVLGARVPVILTSRSDSARTDLISCALASKSHFSRLQMQSEKNDD